MDPTEIRPLETKRQRRKLRTPNPEVRTRLLDAARMLIRERGVSDLRVDEVAQRAGLSVGTFYLYFEGKDALFTSLVVEETARLRLLRQEAQEGATDPLERLGRGLDSYLDFVDQNARAFQYFRRAGSLATNAGDLISWAFEQHAKDYRPTLEQARAQGVLGGVDIELLIQAVLASTQQVAGYWLEHKDSYSREDIQQFISDLSLAVVLGLQQIERSRREDGEPVGPRLEMTEPDDRESG